MTGTYQGFADPGTALTDLSTLQFIIQQAIDQLSTSTIVKIVRAPYDTNGNTITPGSAVPIGFVDVQPLVNQVDGAGNSMPHQTVYKLKYHRYSGGNGAIISDPVIGDQGKMVVADRDTSVVRATNAQGNPGSGRIMDKADGTFFGTTQGSAAPTQYITFLADGIKWHDTDGNEIITNSSGMTVTVAKGNLGATVSNGTATVTASGNITLHSSTSITFTAPTNTITANGNVLG
jgi:hypothetical protein